MTVLINILLPVFLVAGISALAHDRLKLDVESFSRAAFYLFSPAMVLDALVNSDVSGAEFGGIAAGLVLTVLVMWGLGEGAARLLRLEAGTRSAFLVAIILMNSGNYGLPVNLFAFGEPGLARASLYVTVNSMIRSSLGVYLAARSGAISDWTALRRMFGVPVLYAAALGLLVNLLGVTLPEFVLKSAHLLSQGLVPASLLVLGVQMVRTFRERHSMSHAGALGAVLLGRLLVAPLVAYAVGRLLGLSGLTHDVLVLETATPSAVMSLVLATEFDTDVPFAALCILATTLVSLLTVTLWLHVLM